MEILIAYNKHRHGGGSDVVAESTINLLETLADVKVVPFVRDSHDLKGLRGKIRALVSGCYSAEAVRVFSRMLDEEQPDIVHAQEIYPLISPWIFKVCKKKGIPVVMTCHDYRMSCPIATHFRDGVLCYECPEHNELRCIRHNCCGSMAKSIAYAARNYIGRKKRLFLDHVDLFLTPSEKAKEILCRYSGISTERVVAVGNPISAISGEAEGLKGERVEGSELAAGQKLMANSQELIADGLRPYIAYVGRFEPEKGFDILVEALVGIGIPLKVAGNASAYFDSRPSILDHVEFTGHLSHDEIGEFYREARMVIIPSICHETFGLVVAEALSCGTPVVVSDLGALAEVAGPGGLVVPAGDVVALSEAIFRLWNDEALCRQMAEAGREHVKQYSDETYLQNLINAYEKVLA